MNVEFLEENTTGRPGPIFGKLKQQDEREKLKPYHCCQKVLSIRIDSGHLGIPLQIWKRLTDSRLRLPIGRLRTYAYYI